MSATYRPYRVIAVREDAQSTMKEKLFCLAQTVDASLPQGVITTEQLRQEFLDRGISAETVSDELVRVLAERQDAIQKRVVDVKVREDLHVLVSLYGCDDVHGAITPEQLYGLFCENRFCQGNEVELTPIERMQRSGIVDGFDRPRRLLVVNDLVTFSIMYPGGPFGTSYLASRSFLGGTPIDRDDKVVLSIGSYRDEGMYLFALSRHADVAPTNGEECARHMGWKLQVCATLLALKLLSETPANIYAFRGVVKGPEEYNRKKMVLDMLPLRSYLDVIFQQERQDNGFLLEAIDQLDAFIDQEIGLLPKAERNHRGHCGHMTAAATNAKLGRLATLCNDNLWDPVFWQQLIERCSKLNLGAAKELLLSARPIEKMPRS